MIVEKEFIPYQESLELKELGFDEPCIAFYDEIKFSNNIKLSLLSQKVNDILNTIKNTNGTLISAPTFSQAFRWFREKYQISPSIHCMSEQGNSWRYHIPNEGGENNFYTYEEAELACLKKLIEIVKNK